jgi:hypothetical protein
MALTKATWANGNIVIYGHYGLMLISISNFEVIIDTILPFSCHQFLGILLRGMTWHKMPFVEVVSVI